MITLALCSIFCNFLPGYSPIGASLPSISHRRCCTEVHQEQRGKFVRRKTGPSAREREDDRHREKERERVTERERRDGNREGGR